MNPPPTNDTADADAQAPEGEEQEPERKKSGLSRYLATFFIYFVGFSVIFIGATAFITWRKTHTHVLTLRLVPREGRDLPADAAAGAAVVLEARGEAMHRRLQINHLEAEPLPPDRVRLTFRSPLPRPELQESIAYLTLQGRAEFCLVRPNRELTPQEARDYAAEEDLAWEVINWNATVYDLNYPGDVSTRVHPYRVSTEPMVAMHGLDKIDLETRGLAKLAILTLHLPKEKTEAFGEATAANVGRMIALLIDGHMFLPPREVEGPITGGRVQIADTFYMPPIRKLIGIINAGNLPTPVEIESHTIDGQPYEPEAVPVADTPVEAVEETAAGNTP